MTGFSAIFRREFAAYFATPLALVFIVIFLAMSGVFTFYIGGFFDRGQADLRPFFVYHPWLYLFLIPAIAMRLWAEERKSGTIELLLTLPLPVLAIVLGKYMAALAFTGLALALTFPIWITVNYLGDPDNGVILAGYLGSLLMAGGFLAIGSALSAVTQNQVIAFVLTVTVCFLFMVSGLPIVLDWVPELLGLRSIVAGLSMLSHFNAIVEGVIDLRDLLYFFSLIAFWLFANKVIIDLKREAG
ncbi:MAG: ABC transporter permease subunit [Proteobacteria bacterium]|nr:ABC transporter permease subunit [Pseudomonadota bacterium]